MPKNNRTAVRKKYRCSHIYISLSVKIGFQWKQIKALDWNEDGFNFFIDEKIPYSNILFKKGQSKFAGQIMWSRSCDDLTFNYEMMLNALLYEEMDKFDANTSTVERLLNLIRAEGMIDEKKKILSALNPSSDDNEINRRLTERELCASGYRYGVKVQSQDWTDAVKYALEASSAINAMDQVSEGLSQLADTVDQEDSSE